MNLGIKDSDSIYGQLQDIVGKWKNGSLADGKKDSMYNAFSPTKVAEKTITICKQD